MDFKVGDKVVTLDWIAGMAPGSLAEIIKIDTSVKDYPYVVMFTGGGRGYCSDKDIELQLPFNSESFYGSSYSFKKDCDCGGMKTFNNQDPMYHSSWCTLVKGVV